MWQVILKGSEDNKQLAYGIFGSNYFPRTFHYKKDANKLWVHLRELGIKADFQKV